MEFSLPVFATQFCVPLIWLSIVLIDGYRRNGTWRAPQRSGANPSVGSC
jgi:hypothetical protein